MQLEIVGGNPDRKYRYVERNLREAYCNPDLSDGTLVEWGATLKLTAPAMDKRVIGTIHEERMAKTQAYVNTFMGNMSDAGNNPFVLGTAKVKDIKTFQRSSLFMGAEIDTAVMFGKPFVREGYQLQRMNLHFRNVMSDFMDKARDVQWRVNYSFFLNIRRGNSIPPWIHAKSAGLGIVVIQMETSLAHDIRQSVMRNRANAAEG